MDFATIAAGVYTIVSPFIVKGLEKIVDEAAKDGYTERKAIWNKVKGLFVEDELTLLNLFKAAETDVKAQGKLEGKIETHLELNPNTAKELETLVNTVKEIERRNVLTNTVKDVSEDSEVKIDNKQKLNSSDGNEVVNTVENIKNSRITITNDQS
jgi:hypothetical protein